MLEDFFSHPYAERSYLRDKQNALVSCGFELLKGWGRLSAVALRRLLHYGVGWLSAAAPGRPVSFPARSARAEKRPPEPTGKGM